MKNQWLEDLTQNAATEESGDDTLRIVKPVLPAQPSYSDKNKAKLEDLEKQLQRKKDELKAKNKVASQFLGARPSTGFSPVR